MTEYHFKPTRGLAAWLTGLLGLSIGLTLMSFLIDGYWTTYLIYNQAQKIPPKLIDMLSEHGETMDEMQLALNATNVVVTVIFAIVFCVWLYRSAANNRALGASGLKYSPGWTVGWFFIPFANLVMPYRTVREVWLTSQDPADRAVRGAAPLVQAWWVTYILSSAATRIAAIMLKNMNVDDTSEVFQQLFVDMAGLALGIVAAFLSLAIIGRVTHAQLVRHLRAGSMAG
jgi:heme/copper-type cytochrome/quinol oxidase subunit 2